MVTDRLADLVRRALDAAAAAGALVADPPAEITFERPRRKEHGDWATNVALAIGHSKANPRAIADAIVEHLPASDLVTKVDVAGPGFLNFHLAPAWLHEVVRRAATLGSGFGRSEAGHGRKVNVEYVSANPTGPVNVVSGRHAAVGDAISSLLEATGHAVTREFYVNDSGRQIDLFAESLAARYLQHFGREATVPEGGYQGDYMSDLAAEIAEEVGDRYLDVSPEERNDALRRAGLEKMLAQMRSSLERFGTRYDVWFLESALHERNAIDDAIKKMEKRGFTQERDGAVWFLSSKLGDDKDRVLVRSNGEPTYLASDVAYLIDKFERSFDLLMYLWGADHHGTVARLRAAAEAVADGRDKVEVRLLQVVSLSRGAESLKGSKRAGIYVTLDELVDEVGVDAARYTFLTRSIDAPLEFDIALAKEQAPENPVYYVQYAHARICSILRKAEEQGARVDIDRAVLSRLEHEQEAELMRKLAAYEEVVPEAAELRAPQRIARYVEELASTFTAFYRDCRVVSDDAELTTARLALCVATKAVVADGLGLLGVGAPERM